MPTGQTNPHTGREKVPGNGHCGNRKQTDRSIVVTRDEIGPDKEQADDLLYQRTKGQCGGGVVSKNGR